MPRILVFRDKDRFERGKITGSGPKKVFIDITKKIKGILTSKAATKAFTSTKAGVVKFGKLILPLVGVALKTLIDTGTPALTEAILMSIGQKGSQQTAANLRKLLVPTGKFLGELGKKQIDIQIKKLQKGEGISPISPSIPSKSRSELTPAMKRQVRNILKKRRLKLGAGLLTMN